MVKEHYMIVREGWPLVIGFSVLGLVMIFLVPRFGLVPASAGALFFAAGCFSIFFFRDPPRLITAGEHQIVAPADGTVMEIVSGYQSGGKKGTLIKIFLSIFNVHIQRAPVDGTIEDVVYAEGRFLPAMNDRAFRVNERNTVTIRNPKGTVEVSQIAGLIARRIIFRPAKGDWLNKGEQYGLICFGSQVDLFVPDTVAVLVQKGMKVTAGCTVMGEW